MNYEKYRGKIRLLRVYYVGTDDNKIHRILIKRCNKSAYEKDSKLIILTSHSIYQRDNDHLVLRFDNDTSISLDCGDAVIISDYSLKLHLILRKKQRYYYIDLKGYNPLWK